MWLVCPTDVRKIDQALGSSCLKTWSVSAERILNVKCFANISLQKITAIGNINGTHITYYHIKYCHSTAVKHKLPNQIC